MVPAQLQLCVRCLQGLRFGRLAAARWNSNRHHTVAMLVELRIIIILSLLLLNYVISHSREVVHSLLSSQHTVTENKNRA